MDDMVKDYYLSHHGIKGQKWGVRNGPPYPLSEKKTGQKISETTESYKKVKTFVEKFRSQKLSKIGDTQEAMTMTMMLAVPALSILANIGLNKLSEHSLKKSKMREIDQLYQHRDIKSLADAPRLAHRMNAEDSMKVVNPGYPSKGRTMNCTFCTATMAMREKGYDVRARGTDDGFYTDDLFRKTFNSPDVKMPKRTTPDSALKILASHGDNAYGNLTVHWKLGGGHSIFWKNENGRTHIYDAQSGKEITRSNSSMKEFFKTVNCHKLSYNRFDNHEPTEYALALVERNREE